MSEPGTWAWIATAVSIGTTVYSLSNLPEDAENSTPLDKSGTKAPRNVPYGTSRVRGTRVWNGVSNDRKDWAGFVYSYGVGPINRIKQIYVDDVELYENENTFNPSTNPTSFFSLYKNNIVNQDRYKSQKMFVQMRYGQETENALDVFFNRVEGIYDVSNGEWTTDHRGDRVPQLGFLIKSEKNQDAIFRHDRHKVDILCDGLSIHDPRFHNVGEKSFVHESPVPLQNRQCGRNPALIMLDFLTDTYYGMKIPPEYVNEASFIAAANWTDLREFFLDGVIDTSETFGSILAKMLSTFQGILVIEDGQITCKYEDTVLVPYSTTFDDSNIIEFKDITGASDSNYYNVVEVEYKNAQSDEEIDVYQLPNDIDSPESRVSSDGYIKTKKIELPLTIDNVNSVVDGAAKYFANIAYAKSTFQKGVTISVDLKENPVKVYDVIKITNSDIGWDEKLFRISTIQKSVEDDSFNIGELVCVEYSDDMYVGDLNGITGIKSGFTTINRLLNAPLNLSFSLDNYINDGVGTLTWEDPNLDDPEDDDNTYEVQYKLSSVTEWTFLTNIFNGTTAKAPSLRLDDYDFRVRVKRIGMSDSEWNTIINQSVVPVVILPQITGLISDTEGRDFLYSWDDMLGAAVGNVLPADDPNSNGSTGTVGDYFSYYEVTVKSGLNIRQVYQTTTHNFVYKYEDNLAQGLDRNITIDVAIVAIDGTKSTIVSVNDPNTQIGLPSNLIVDNRLGASTVTWDVRPDLDYAGTNVYISTTSGFTPNISNLSFNTIGNSYSFVFPEGDTATRYVKISHYDAFDENSLGISIEVALSFVAVSEELDQDLAQLEADLNELNNVTLPALETDLATNTTNINTLNNTTLPALETDLATNTTSIDTLNNTTIPALQDNINDNIGGNAFTLVANDADTTVTPTTITKISGTTDWNTGAYSLEDFVNVSLSFAPKELNRDAMLGLSNDDGSSSHHNTIDYAIFLTQLNSIQIWESQAFRGTFFTSYLTTDVFSVEIRDGIVTYLKNGVVFYTSTVPASGRYRVDASLSEVNSGFENISVREIGAIGQDRYTWTVYSDLKGHSIERVSGASAWNTGAYSLEDFVNVSLSFTPKTLTQNAMLGLSNDDGSSDGFITIDYAIYTNGNDVVEIYESGTNRGIFFTSYLTTDVFSVEIRDGVVTYLKNDVVFYTSTVPASGRYRVDASVLNVNSGFENISVNSNSNITLIANDTDTVVDASGNNIYSAEKAITKTSGASAWNTGAYSLEDFVNVSLSFTPKELNKHAMIGLSNDDGSSGDFTTIDYAIYTRFNNDIRVYESGTNRGIFFTSYLTTDVFSVEIRDGEVTYLKNGVVFYTSTVPASGRYRVDASLRGVDSGFENIDLKEIINDELSDTEFVLASNDANTSVINDRRYIGVSHNQISETPDLLNRGLYKFYLASKVIDLSDNTVLVNELNGSRIVANSITASELAAGSVTASEINVGSLSAISADLGTVTAGTINGGTINGGTISGATIIGNEISGGTVTGTTVNGGTITGTTISGGTILGNQLAAGSVTALEINIAELSALSAELGTINSGTITGATIRTSALSTVDRITMDGDTLKYIPANSSTPRLTIGSEYTSSSGFSYNPILEIGSPTSNAQSISIESNYGTLATGAGAVSIKNTGPTRAMYLYADNTSTTAQAIFADSRSITSTMDVVNTASNTTNYALRAISNNGIGAFFGSASGLPAFKVDSTVMIPDLNANRIEGYTLANLDLRYFNQTDSQAQNGIWIDATTGYCRQWGYINLGTDSGDYNQFNFPDSFTTCYGVNLTSITTRNNGGDYQPSLWTSSSTGKVQPTFTNTYFRYTHSGNDSGIMWEAWGKI